MLSGKMVLFGNSGCIREKEVVYRAKMAVLGRSGCIRAIVVVFGQS